MKILLLTVCLISSNTFATSVDASKMLNQIDEQIKAIEESVSNNANKNETSNYFESLGNTESKIWGHIADLYELYRSHQVHERYFFLLEATNAMSIPLDQRGFYLEEWAATMNKRAHKIVGLRANFFKVWNSKMNLLNADIEKFVKLSRSEATPTHTSITAQASKIKELTKALQAIPPKVIERQVIVEKVKTTNNYPFMVGAFLAGLSLMYLLRRKSKKSIEQVVPVAATPVEIPAMAAFNTVSVQAPREMTPPTQASRHLTLEEVSRRCLEKNQHLFNLATLDVQHQNPSPFDTNINISSEKLSDAINWMIKGIISLKNTAIENEAKLDWVCKKNKDRVSVDFILKNVTIDAQKLQENAIINGDGSAPAHFGRCEQLLANHFPTVKIKPTNKHTIISLGLESYTASEMTH